MCGCSDYDGPSVYGARMRVARVHHRCDECRGTIEPGQLYVRITGCWDGRWDSFNDCRKCDAMRQAWHDTEGCWPSHGNLLDDVLECLRGEARQTWEGDFEDPSPRAHPINLAFGMNYRRRLGHMGPRRAA